MWRRNAILLGLLCGLSCPQTAKGSDSNKPSLLANSPWVRFDLILGRVTARKRHAGQGRRKHSAKNEFPHEVLAINALEIAPRISYERIDDQRRVVIEIANQNEVVIRHSPVAANTGPIVHYQQMPGRPVELDFSNSGVSNSYRFESLWHLLIAEPAVSQQYLVPALRLLKPDWDPVETARRIQDRVLAVSHQEVAITPHQLKTLVQQLDASSYSRRRAADRELRNRGVGILPALRQLDKTNLSPEQRLRVTRIEERLSSPTADVPLRVATWLANDPQLWMTMLADDSAAKRELAFSKLGILCDESITFDPTAGETTRREQIAHLRETLILR